MVSIRISKLNDDIADFINSPIEPHKGKGAASFGCNDTYESERSTSYSTASSRRSSSFVSSISFTEEPLTQKQMDLRRLEELLLTDN